MDFKGAAKRIDDIDLPRIGDRIDVDEDVIHAVIDVESSGSGFDKQGRPKMLFEPHIFHRLTSGSTRLAAVNAKLAYPKWKPGSYPADSYPRLKRAMASAWLDANAATENPGAFTSAAATHRVYTVAIS
jgi:hypothetical protein